MTRATRGAIASAYNTSAWVLATTSDPRERDPTKAVELANKAIALSPQAGSFWLTLGIAHYRTGAWREAITALDKSEELAPGQSAASNGFFQAMARWQLHQKDEARSRYERACQWTDQHVPNDPELHRFRIEAAKLLGLPIPPAPPSLPPAAAEELLKQLSSK